jgi:hypothetical protein
MLVEGACVCSGYAVVCGLRCPYAARRGKYVGKSAGTVVLLGILAVVWRAHAGIVGLGVTVVSQSIGDAPLGDVLLSVDALGVDTQEHFDTMSRPFGHLSRCHAAVEPQ